MSKTCQQQASRKPGAGISGLLLVSWGLLALILLSKSFAFYNINHHKLVVALAGTALLTCVICANRFLLARRPKLRTEAASTQGVSRLTVLLLALPLLATLPGFLVSDGSFNYFLTLEVATWIVCCCWVLLLAQLVRTPEQLLSMLIALALISLAASVMAILNFVTGDLGISLTATNRESGSFGNPNYLAAFLSIQLPVFLVCLAPAWHFQLPRQKLTYLKALLVLVIVTTVVALISTQARAAQLSFLIAALGLVVIAYWQPRLFGISRRFMNWALLAALLFILLAALLLPVSEYLTARFQTGSTMNSRLVPWQAAWRSIKEAPILGWGPGSSYALFFEYVDPASRLEWFQRRYAHPHNEYLEILQEGGILALIAYLGMLAYFVHLAIGVLKHPDTQQPYKLLILGLGAGILSYHLLAIFSVAPRMVSVRLVLFIQLTIILILHNLTVQHKKHAAEAETYEFKPGFFSSPVDSTALLVTVALLIGVSACLYYPDGVSRLRFVNALREDDGLTQIRLLRNLRDSSPNIYALEALAQRELAVGEFESALSTIETMERVVPNFDTTGFLRASALLLTDRIAEARLAAQTYQQRDSYHTETALLLAKIALITREEQLLLDQLEILLTIQLATESQLELADGIRLGIHDQTITAAVIEIRPRPFMQIKFSRSAIAEVLTTGRAALLSTPEISAPQAQQPFESFARGLAGNIAFSGFAPDQSEAVRQQLSVVLMRVVSTSL